VRALRLLAERRIGRPLSHVDATELVRRHGGVDVAIDTLVTAERARERALATAAHRAIALPAAARGVTVPAARESPPSPRLTRIPSRIGRIALVAGAVGAALVGVSALGRVVVAARAGHGALATLILGSALLVAAVIATGALRRAPGRAPWREGVALAMTAVGALAVDAIDQCALTAPLGLGILLVQPVLAGAIAAVAGAIALSAATSFSDRESRAPARAGSRTPA
jgi:hypothetical protein